MAKMCFMCSGRKKMGKCKYINVLWFEIYFWDSKEKHFHCMINGNLNWFQKYYNFRSVL